MNDIFDFRRFGWYARKELSENWKAIALSAIAITTLIGFYTYQEWEFVHSINYESDYVVKTAWSLAIPIILGIMIASSFVWKAFSNKKDTFSALMLPVSVTERFVFAWLVAVPFLIIICVLIAQVCWAIVTPLLLQDFPKIIIEPMSGGETSKTNQYGSVLLFSGPALFMWGAVTLGRLNFLKTLGLIIIVGVAFWWLQNEHLEAIFPSGFDSYFSSMPPIITIQSLKYIYSTKLVSDFEGVYRIWWVLIVPLMLYACVFLKLKEKEI